MKDLIGNRFGKLLVISPTNKRDGRRGVIWLCKCDCGNTKEINSRGLIHDNIKSCGCLLKWKNIGYVKRKHYHVWYYIISRCYNKKNKGYRNYGEKGIKVCDEWKNDYWSFHKWMEEQNWQKGLQVDRFPNQKGNYEPNNCRLATSKMQQNNRTNNVPMELNGIIKNVSEWALEYDKKPTTVFDRLRDGWDLLTALTLDKQVGWHKKQRNKKGQFK
jgi:hypothetical protein